MKIWIKVKGNRLKKCHAILIHVENVTNNDIKLKKAYKENILSTSTVCDWHKRAKWGRSTIKDDERRGLPRDVGALIHWCIYEHWLDKDNKSLKSPLWYIREL